MWKAMFDHCVNDRNAIIAEFRAMQEAMWYRLPKEELVAAPNCWH
jgi:hypothetical protein